MEHPIYRVESFEIIAPYTLHIRFDDKTEQNVDFRLVLAGDHRQLPPTILTQEAAMGGLATSLFERLLALHGEPLRQMLREQYRMNVLSDEEHLESLIADGRVLLVITPDGPPSTWTSWGF